MKFNIEEQIAHWKKQLRKYKAFEDGDIDELEDHLRSKMSLKMTQGLDEKTAFDQVIAEDYENMESISSQFEEQRSNPSMLPSMLANYFKVGLRFLGRTKVYFSINLIGLIIGLTSVLYIAFYVNFELSYDKFHENSDAIYRVNTKFERASGSIHYPIIPPAFGPAIQNDIPETIHASRLRYAYNILMQNNEQSFYEERVFFAEAAFLEMFSFDWVSGSPENALQEINTIVLTERMATKYFGEQNPIGEIVRYNDEIDLKVIGIIADVPEQSHFTFDFLISFDTFKPGPGSLEPMTSWAWLGFLTYVQLSPEADINVIEGQLAEMFKQNSKSKSNLTVQIELQPLEDIYLTSGGLSNPQGGLFKVNDPENLMSLGIIAILIIVISFFNYFNITSALMRTRAKEIGIRKVFGSSKRKVFVQMGTETLIIMLIASMISWLLISVLIQNDLLQIAKNSVQRLVAFTFTIIAVFTLLSSLLFGSTFSSYSAIALLRNKLTQVVRSKFSLSRMVLLLQFGISASLIMISMIVITQLDYFSKKDLGYNNDGVLLAKFRSEEMNARRDTYVDAMLQLPAVKAVSFGPSLDGSSSGGPLRLKEWPEDQVIQTAYFGVDYQFNEILDLEIVKGRFFSKDYARDSVESILINEKMAEMLGVDEPLGQRVAFTASEYEIIGIYKDFHYQSLHHEIGPMALQMWLGQPRNVLIRYESDNIGQTLQEVEATWREVFSDGDFPFDYRFLDEQLQAMYQKETAFATMLKVFTSLAIFLALLGLFGLSSINIHQKIKQIGIRRILGAEMGQIAGLVSKRYLITSLIGILLSLPFAYYFMKNWLADYAYSIELNLTFPIITTLIVVGITALTLSIQVYRVMTVNPVSILRDE